MWKSRFVMQHFTSQGCHNQLLSETKDVGVTKDFMPVYVCDYIISFGENWASQNLDKNMRHYRVRWDITRKVYHWTPQWLLWTTSREVSLRKWNKKTLLMASKELYLFALVLIVLVLLVLSFCTPVTFRWRTFFISQYNMLVFLS